jgi:hypothetical protein
MPNTKERTRRGISDGEKNEEEEEEEDRRSQKTEILPIPSLEQPQTSVLGFRPRNRRSSSTVGLSFSDSRPSSNPPLT